MDLAAPIERALSLLQGIWLSFAGRFGLSAVLDIAIVTLLLYWLLSLISGTSAATLVRRRRSTHADACRVTSGRGDRRARGQAGE